MRYQTQCPCKLEASCLLSAVVCSLTRIPALVEPIAVAWHSINTSPFKKGDKVLVLGGGPIGLAVIQCLKAKGAGTIIASEVAPRRKDFAKKFGAQHVLDPTQDDVVTRVKEICGGVGADLAFDAAGVQAGLNQALKAIRARGTLVNIAVWEKPAQLQVNDLVFRERKYVGVATYVAGDFRDVLDAIATGKTLNSIQLSVGLRCHGRNVAARTDDHECYRDGRS